MSTIQITNWDRLARALACVTDEDEERMKQELNVKEVCIVGFTKSTYAGYTFRDLMTKFGFSTEERRQKRCCVINGCPFESSMFNILNHYIGYHHIKLRDISKLIPIMQEDTRTPEPQSLKKSIQTLHMTKD